MAVKYRLSAESENKAQFFSPNFNVASLFYLQ